ncbi:MAG: serine/threonine protein kinase [Alphaproteobacteria bacterium]|nr:serine/threonine protein kinase [Alphaproteobacteria bacterium]
MATPPPDTTQRVHSGFAPDTWVDTGSTEAYRPVAANTLPSEPVVPVQTIDRYRVAEVLGRGGMGVVYSAYDPHLQRKVAVKVLVGAAHASTEGRERFLREARAIAGLDHPNVVRIYDIGQHDGALYFAMEMLAGGSLRERLAQGERMALLDAVSLVAKVAEGLAVAHHRGLIHRDVKPANVMLDDQGQPRITDFGIVATASADSRLTRVGEIIGTPAYMAPEQARGDAAAISPATDVYALGVILAEAVLGEHPMTGCTSEQMLDELREGRGVSLRALEKRVPGELFVVLARALAAEPGERYPDGAELAADLWRFHAGEPVLARSPTPLTRVRWAVRRNRRQLGGVVLSVALLIAGGGATWGFVAARAAREQARVEGVAMARVEEVEGRLQAMEARGATAKVDARFAELVAEEELEGTRALVLAWVAQAERQRARGDQAGALSSLARAWSRADLDPDRAHVLASMAAIFEAEAALPSLAAVHATMSREGLLPADPAAVARLEALTALGRLDLEPAGQGFGRAGQDDLARVLAALSRQEPAHDGLVEVQRVHDTPPQRLHEALPGLALVDTVVNAAWTGDVDGDGADELVVGTAEYDGQDVRVHERDGDAWRLAARRRLGEVADLTIVPSADRPRIAALVQDRRTRGLPRPDDAPAFTGLVLLDYDEGALAVEQRLPLPDRDWQTLLAADLDGDGTVELIATAAQGAMLVVGPRTDQPATAWLPGLRVQRVVQGDEDAADELLAVDTVAHASVVLGVGARSAARSIDLPQPEPPPADLTDPGLAESWARAEQLVALGLPGPAADELAALARSEDASAVGVLAGRRAAVLLEQADRRAEVAGLLRDSARHVAPGDPLALDIAGRLRGLLDLRGEQAVLGSYLEGAAADAPGFADARARWEVLQAHHRAAPLVVDPALPLDPAWRIAAPDLVRRRPQEGVLAVQPVGAEELARLPLRLDGRPVEVLVDVAIERGELGSGLVFALQPAGGATADGPEISLVAVGVDGGPGNLQLSVEGFGGDALTVPDGPGGAGPLQWSGRLGITLDAEQARRRLALETQAEGASEVVRVDALPDGIRVPPGDYDLVLRSRGPGCSMSRYLVREIAMVGGVLPRDAATDDPLATAARLLAENQPEAALDALGDADAPWLRYLAHDQLGQERRAHAALRALLAADAVDPVRLLQAAPDRAAPRLADLQGRDWLQSAGRAWSCAVAAHPEDPEVTQVLSWNLRDLDLVEAEAVSDPDARLLLAQTLRARARAWAVRSERPRSRATLQHALRMLDGIDGSEGGEGGVDPDLRARVRQARAWILVDMAVLTLGDEGQGATLPLVYRALRASPTPEVLGDALVVDPRLAPLWADDNGAGLVAAARTGELPPAP